MRARGRRSRCFFISLHGDGVTVGFVSALMETPMISDLDDLRPHQGFCFTTIAQHCEEVDEEAGRMRSVGSCVAASGNHPGPVAGILDRARWLGFSSCPVLLERLGL
ncbi:hypothetical protein Droror1_Dr00016941 [Drosera rotundifolia]